MDRIEVGCVICDRKAECFKYLTRKELELFDNSKSTVHYGKGETILKQGTEFTHVVSFNAGLAKLNVEVNKGKNVMIGIIKPSEIIGGPGMFHNNHYSFSVTALTDASICLVSVDIFKKMIAVNEQFAESFLSSFSSRYTEVINRLVSMSHKHIYGRVAESLLYISDKIYEDLSFSLPLSRQELAEYTGTTKESISRIFKNFHSDNLIKVNGRQITILNSNKLKEIMLKG